MTARLKWLWEEVLLTLLGVRWLGHGRAVESMLTLIAATYGTALIVSPGVLAASAATADLAWVGHTPGYVLAAALITKALLTGTGLVANIQAWRWSRFFRFAGALLGSMVWSWYLVKFVQFGEPVSLGSVFAAWAFIYSIRIMALALANLPRPGAPSVL